MKPRDWRRWLSDIMILAGLFVILGGALFVVKAALAAQLLEADAYLVSEAGIDLPLPTLTATPTPAPTQEPTPVPPTATPTPTPVPPAGPVTRLVIPRLQVNRGVIPVGLYRKGGQLQWNTDSLFANGNRNDLVGQLVTSVNPGDGGNIVLVGHNYNQGWNAWGGVFVNLKNMRPGDKITLYTKDGGEHTYVVQRVKKVPWQQKNANEIEKHQQYMWPTENEQLTLVTCGGANIFSWTARIYVVALPLNKSSNLIP